VQLNECIDLARRGDGPALVETLHRWFRNQVVVKVETRRTHRRSWSGDSDVSYREEFAAMVEEKGVRPHAGRAGARSPIAIAIDRARAFAIARADASG
jgi:hypothetical protein